MKRRENPFDQLNSPLLTDRGLNLQAAFSVAALPAEISRQVVEIVGEMGKAGWLLLLGNGGSRFWDQLPERAWDLAQPLDQQAVEITEQYLQSEYPGRQYKVLYPSDAPVGLQQLGKLAGWHYDSPLKLGINPVFGLWYAYRALFWVEGEPPVTECPQMESPCGSCREKPCIAACPANALSADFPETHKQLEACIDYRLLRESPCQSNCLARMRCPVQKEQRYSQQQLNYHYRQSYQTIVRWRS